jgi:hypothetical protein
MLLFESSDLLLPPYYFQTRAKREVQQHASVHVEKQREQTTARSSKCCSVTMGSKFEDPLCLNRSVDLDVNVGAIDVTEFVG